MIRILVIALSLIGAITAMGCHNDPMSQTDVAELKAISRVVRSLEGVLILDNTIYKQIGTTITDLFYLSFISDYRTTSGNTFLWRQYEIIHCRLREIENWMLILESEAMSRSGEPQLVSGGLSKVFNINTNIKF